MLENLTPEQRAKLIAGWKWQKNQTGLWVREHDPEAAAVRVRYVQPCFGGIRAEVVDDDGKVWRPLPRELSPDLDDPVTSDGLLRTARAMWQDQTLHIAPTSRADGWIVARRGNKPLFDGREFFAIEHPCDHVVARYDSEKEALLAAILAAPEPK